MEASEYARQLQPLLGRAAGYARSILRSRPDAEDAVQQAALQAFERIHTYDRAKPFNGWWFAVLRNCCLDALRRAKAHPSERLENHDLPVSESGSVENWERLSAALEELSQEHREIVRLRYFANLSYRELAAALNIPQGTVMSRLHAARNALAAKLGEEE